MTTKHTRGACYTTGDKYTLSLYKEHKKQKSKLFFSGDFVDKTEKHARGIQLLKYRSDSQLNTQVMNYFVEVSEYLTAVIHVALMRI